MFDDIQSDEFVPAQYEMTADELAEFQKEYNQYLDESAESDRPLYIWLR